MRDDVASGTNRGDIQRCAHLAGGESARGDRWRSEYLNVITIHVDLLGSTGWGECRECAEGKEQTNHRFILR